MKGLVFSIILATLIHAAILLPGNRLLIPKGSSPKKPKSISLTLLDPERPAPTSTNAPFASAPPPKPGPRSKDQFSKRAPIPQKKRPSIPKPHPPKPKKKKTGKRLPASSNTPSTVTKPKPKPKLPFPTLPPTPTKNAPLTAPSTRAPSPVKEDNSRGSEIPRQELPASTASSSLPSKGIVLARPRYMVNRPPSYPLLARRRGYQGTVLLRVLVTEEGKVSKLKVEKSSGFKILDKAAVKAVKHWLFEPGTQGGKRVEMWVKVPICFRLQ